MSSDGSSARAGGDHSSTLSAPSAMSASGGFICDFVRFILLTSSSKERYTNARVGANHDGPAKAHAPRDQCKQSVPVGEVTLTLTSGCYFRMPTSIRS